MGDGGGPPRLTHWFLNDGKRSEPYVEVQSLIDGLMRDDITDEELVSAIKGMADEGDPDAQYVLGTAYQYGLGLEHSDEKSFEWYRKTIDQGHLPALHDMAGFYLFGIGVHESPEKAFEMLERASDGGLAEAFKQIAWMYGAGHGMEKSETESFR
ncbi:MAG: sel1 repeat family protein [Candidatus Methanomethylophilaceae archaeon]|nr:sel1 repeat family protein [Candidatus Methanomethylophilaceae archaeon]MBR7005940.1 sel1 repeat family protein [Candidatus Methanomethylophilaceae archaeon]